MGYRDHYANTAYTTGTIRTAAEADRILHVEEPIGVTSPLALILSDEGNQERFVLQGTKHDLQALIDSLATELRFLP